MTTAHAQRTLFVAVAGLCAVLVLFVWWYEALTLAEAEKQTHRYGRYLEIPLWNLDENATTQYLQLISQSGKYRSIEIIHADGSPFVGIETGYAANPFDKFLSFAQLIHDETIIQFISYNDRPWGRIEAVWINDNIYVYIAAALILALCGKIHHYYFRLTANRHVLEQNNIELQLSEKNLRESEDYLQRITESLGEGLLITDMEDVILYANSRIGELTGYDKEEMLGRPAFELFSPPQDHARVAERNMERQRGISEQYEIAILHKDGHLFWVRIHATPFRNSAGEIIGTLGAVNDITERKQLEDQLQQAQKMDAIGQLTAGIAHNFNNMLLGIMGNIEFAIEDGPEHIKPYLNESFRISEQAAEMVAQLMAYSHSGVYTQNTPLDLPTTIERTASICRNTFDRKITIRTEVAGALPTVSGDGGQIEQSLLNLMINARDAVAHIESHTPTIRLQASVITHDATTAAKTTEAREGTFVRLQVSDNGKGMDADTRERVFDPFFTTKEVGEGTGLGLSTVYGTAHLHGGWVECASQLGEGAIFSLYLPLATEPEAKSKHDASVTASVGSETILVIDDEVSVRQILSRGLSKYGYTVLLASNGREGLDILQQHDVDLVLLDLSMPLVSGRDVLIEMRKANIGCKIIVFTGYAVNKDQFADVDDVMQKPLRIADLVHKVRQTLDA